MKTLADENFILPAEWEPHQGTWVSYPHNRESFYEKMNNSRDTFVDFIALIAEGEEVHINVNDASIQDDLMRRLEKKEVKKNVVVHSIKTDDAWCRDYGAIFIKNHETGELRATNWVFNAWGGKYPYARDAAVAEKMAEFLGLDPISVNMILEGGSIETNGKGVFLTTEDCLLNENRNPNMNQKKIEKVLKDYLGAKKILWLGKGLDGDDTDSHIDTIARFTDENTIVCAFEDDPDDVNEKNLKDNYNRLKSFRNLGGKPFKIVPLPMPDPFMFHIGRLPATYLNFYIANSAVIVPTFGCAQDELALGVLEKLFEGRRVVGLDAKDIVVGQGAFHCLTQQIPK